MAIFRTTPRRQHAPPYFIQNHSQAHEHIAMRCKDRSLRLRNGVEGARCASRRTRPRHADGRGLSRGCGPGGLCASRRRVGRRRPLRTALQGGAMERHRAADARRHRALPCFAHNKRHRSCQGPRHCAHFRRRYPRYPRQRHRPPQPGSRLRRQEPGADKGVVEQGAPGAPGHGIPARQGHFGGLRGTHLQTIRRQGGENRRTRPTVWPRK